MLTSKQLAVIGIIASGISLSLSLYLYYKGQNT